MKDQRKKILVVDDEEDLTYFLKANLEIEENYEVFIVTRAKDAFKSALKYKPDLIILDIMMPQVDGIEILEKIKNSKNTLDIPVIILSAKIDDATKIKAAKLYVECYITKPVQIEELKEKIKEVFLHY
ncbi:MAG: response regulator [Candidatus Omnitrophica bacterium]|nr:response regulator [Candidatus Omnitrophota bacterium]MCF7877286.1 response regulator [Candidatus Omnitrophota bacterium]MCF7891601.1 response regulator [Candidatus Omnitrophota bacterium]MCF7895899.1 response regulator [Candidatus Omnitrophota bacterium]MCF7897553.1 response regulator [Candidatus Omnitrophota bacterium]